MPSAPMQDGADQRGEESGDQLIEYLSGVALFTIDLFCLCVHGEETFATDGECRRWLMK